MSVTALINSEEGLKSRVCAILIGKNPPHRNAALVWVIVQAWDMVIFVPDTAVIMVPGGIPRPQIACPTWVP